MLTMRVYIVSEVILQQRYILFFLSKINFPRNDVSLNNVMIFFLIPMRT